MPDPGGVQAAGRHHDMPYATGPVPARLVGSAVMHCAAQKDVSLSLSSRTNRGGYVIAVLNGELSVASAPALREQLLKLLRAASHLIIDLSAVTHAEVGGLAVLVGSGHRARLLGGSLRLAAPSPEAAWALSATGINRHLDIFPTVRAAITGQPRLPGPVFRPAAVPVRGRIEDAVPGWAAEPAMPVIDLATATAGQGSIS